MENNRAEKLASFIELNLKKIELLQIEIEMFNAELSFFAIKESIADLSDQCFKLEALIAVTESKLGLNLK